MNSNPLTSEAQIFKSIVSCIGNQKLIAARIEAESLNDAKSRDDQRAIGLRAERDGSSNGRNGPVRSYFSDRAVVPDIDILGCIDCDCA